jgi:gluconate 5-dehydrogenase
VASRFDLTGRVAIVTGAGAGIGRRIARGLAGEGATVVVADLNRAAASTVTLEIEAEGGSSAAVEADVTDPGDVARLVDETVARFGTVDILVNNAGGGRGYGATVDLSLSEWQGTMDLTLTSAFLCAQAAGKVMIAQGRGKVINIASVYGIVGHDPTLYDPMPSGEHTESLAYATAKGAIISMTRALAIYWAKHNIQVNAIAPGMVRTERLAQTISPDTWGRLSARTPMGRPADPEDMAGAAIYLASDASSYVTGQILVVDGGWTVW